MKLCAIVITYYPNVENTVDNIKQYLPWVDKLIIWENTPAKDIDNYKFRFDNSSKILYHGTGENVGISKALNWAVEYASNNGFTHLLTMDQDSSWSNFNSYRQIIESKSGNLSFFVPLVNGRINSKNNVHITSGMIVPIEVFRKVGGYCEDFKIDVIDYEFCIRCSINKIFPTIIKSADLRQKFGSPVIKKFLGHQIKCSNYSPFRLFEIAKNYTILIKSYNISFSEEFGLFKFWLLKTPLKILLFENNKFSKFKALTSGVMVGLRHPKLDVLK